MARANFRAAEPRRITAHSNNISHINFYPRAGRRFTPCRLRPAPRAHTSVRSFVQCGAAAEEDTDGNGRKRPGCRSLAEPPPLTSFDSRRAPRLPIVSTPTPWTRPGLRGRRQRRASSTPPSLAPLPPPRFTPGSRLGSLCAWALARCRPMKAGSRCRVRLGSHSIARGENALLVHRFVCRRRLSDSQHQVLRPVDASTGSTDPHPQTSSRRRADEPPFPTLTPSQTSGRVEGVAPKNVSFMFVTGSVARAAGSNGLPNVSFIVRHPARVPASCW